jgi:hypothetical protein
MPVVEWHPDDFAHDCDVPGAKCAETSMSSLPSACVAALIAYRAKHGLHPFDDDSPEARAEVHSWENGCREFATAVLRLLTESARQQLRVFEAYGHVVVVENDAAFYDAQVRGCPLQDVPWFCERDPAERDELRRVIAIPKLARVIRRA